MHRYNSPLLGQTLIEAQNAHFSSNIETFPHFPYSQTMQHSARILIPEKKQLGIILIPQITSWGKGGLHFSIQHYNKLQRTETKQI